MTIEKSRLNYLPPRIPGLEKLGIADGTMKKDLSNLDLMVGNNLPKEVSKLNSPLTKKEFVEALGIKYHPYDYQIISIEGTGEEQMATIQLTGSTTTETIPVRELMSKY